MFKKKQIFISRLSTLTMDRSFTNTCQLLKTADKPPENCIDIGDGLHVIVSLNEYNIDIQICEFVRNIAGELLPTENGIVLSPFLWESLCKSMNDAAFVDLPSSFECFSMIENQLFLSVIKKYITMQRCALKRDFSRYFIPGILLMSNCQWTLLKHKNRLVSEKVANYLIKHELKSWVLLEKQTLEEASQSVELEKIEAEMELILSLCEFLKIYLVKAVTPLVNDKVSDEENMTKYFYLAFTTFEWKQLAFEYVRENNRLLKFVTHQFFDNLNVNFIIDFVCKLY